MHQRKMVRLMGAAVVLAEAGVFASRGEARRMIAGGGVTINGERVSDPRMVPGDVARGAALARSGLTRREYEVLRLAAQGRTNPEIAETTGLARNTVKTYLHRARKELASILSSKGWGPRLNV